MPTTKANAGSAALAAVIVHTLSESDPDFRLRLKTNCEAILNLVGDEEEVANTLPLAMRYIEMLAEQA